MEHDDLEKAQRMRYQMGLPPLAENAVPLGFTNLLKEKLPVRSCLETTAMSGGIVDRFKKARDDYLEKMMREGMTATEIAGSIREDVYRHTPLRNREDVRTIMQDLDWLRKKEAERMLYGSVYIRVVESEHITKEVQARQHRKKRINKKWRKRYGTKRVPDLNTMVLYQEPSGERVLLAHPKQVEKLRNQIRMDSKQNIRFDFSEQLHNREE